MRTNPFYFGRRFSKDRSLACLIRAICGRPPAVRKVRIPALRFVVFYNGSGKQPERQLLKLSDLYTIKEDDPMLELKVEFFNINKGFNQELKEACQSLKEYMLFVERIREYSDQEELPLDEAVDPAVTEFFQMQRQYFRR